MRWKVSFNVVLETSLQRMDTSSDFSDVHDIKRSVLLYGSVLHCTEQLDPQVSVEALPPRCLLRDG